MLRCSQCKGQGLGLGMEVPYPATHELELVDYADIWLLDDQAGTLPSSHALAGIPSTHSALKLACGAELYDSPLETSYGRNAHQDEQDTAPGATECVETAHLALQRHAEAEAGAPMHTDWGPAAAQRSLQHRAVCAPAGRAACPPARGAGAGASAFVHGAASRGTELGAVGESLPPSSAGVMSTAALGLVLAEQPRGELVVVRAGLGRVQPEQDHGAAILCKDPLAGFTARSAIVCRCCGCLRQVLRHQSGSQQPRSGR